MEEAVRCPSYRCQAGAILLGIVGGDGRVIYAADLIVIDQEFVDEARKGRAPEKRFRFAGDCARGSCRQWTGHRCSVIDRVLVDLGGEAQAELPACAIRRSCRWFLQSGATACAACPEVISDMTDAMDDLGSAGGGRDPGN